MALRLTLNQTPVGVACPAAYARISGVRADKNEASVLVVVYASEAARQQYAQEIEVRQHSVSTASLSGALWPAVYAAIKALPEYVGAEDC